MSRYQLEPTATAAAQPEPEAVPVAAFARRTGLSRTLLYRAMHADPAYRGSLPFLPSVKVGRCRRIRLETGREWLARMEVASSGERA